MSNEERQRTPGISRIDQPEKRTHGFFVRLQRKGKMFTGFFGDKSHGGRDQALEAAQVYYQGLRRKHKATTRRDWLNIRRRRGASPYIGVQKVRVVRANYRGLYWCATWSPQPGVVKKRMFSIRKHGARQALALALKARRDGLASLGDARLEHARNKPDVSSPTPSP
jgi:hypothetical protein